MKPTQYAIIGEQVVAVEVLRLRQSDRTARVLAGGVETAVPKSLLFPSEAEAQATLVRWRDHAGDPPPSTHRG